MAILKRIKDLGQLAVNCKWCLQIHEDSDLQTLLKKGLVQRKRMGQFWSKTTYLILTPRGENVISK